MNVVSKTRRMLAIHLYNANASPKEEGIEAFFMVQVDPKGSLGFILYCGGF
jgi:hypothetical protein